MPAQLHGQDKVDRSKEECRNPFMVRSLSIRKYLEANMTETVDTKNPIRAHTKKVKTGRNSSFAAEVFSYPADSESLNGV